MENMPAPGCGTVFKLNKAGKETVLYRFGQVPDGNFPVSGLIRDATGDLYGTTYWGGTSDSCGTVFKVTKTGTETVVQLRGWKVGWMLTAGGPVPQRGGQSLRHDRIRHTMGNSF